MSLEIIAEAISGKSQVLVEKQRYAELVSLCKNFGVTEVWSTFTEFDFSRNASGHMAIKADDEKSAKSAERAIYKLLAPDFFSDDESVLMNVSLFIVTMFPNNPSGLESVEDLMDKDDYALIYASKEG